MGNSLTKAYGGGKRAGLAQNQSATNPYKAWHQFVLAFLWDEGWHNGMSYKLTTWLKSRKGNL